jgi:hypothetical protein
MPYIVIHSWYPHHIVDKTAKKYLEVAKKYPMDESWGNMVVPGAVNSSKEGLEALVLFQVKKEKIGDALETVNRAMSEFRNFQGFNWEITTWATMDEALQRSGVKKATKRAASKTRAKKGASARG